MSNNLTQDLSDLASPPSMTNPNVPTLDMDGNLTNLTSVSTASLTVGTTTMNAAELGYIDGVVAGHGAASKALVLGGDQSIDGIAQMTISGTQNALTISNSSSTSRANLKLINDNRSLEIGLRGSADTAPQNGFYISDSVGGIRLIVSSSGNVGIGTTAASYKCDVAGSINCSADYYRGGALVFAQALVGVSDTSGAVAGKALVLDSNKATTGITSISSNTILAIGGTASTSASTGSLVVTGGVGISGALFTSGTARAYTAAASERSISVAPTVLTNATGGTDSNHRSTVSLGASTYIGSSSTTTTTASTLYISGPPTPGTNMVITNPYALYAAGPVYAMGTAQYVVNTSFERVQQWSSDNATPVLAELQLHSGAVATSTNGMNFGTASANDMSIITGNTRRLTITAAGNVGVGTTTPGALLDVSGTANASGFSLAGSSIFMSALVGVSDTSGAIAGKALILDSGKSITGITALSAGTLSATATTATQSATSGALVVAGGIGVKGGIWGGGSTTVFTATAGSESLINYPTSNTIMSNTFATSDGTARYTYFLGAPTYTASSTTTTTNATTLYVSGAPAAGTNQTITNAYAFVVGAGRSSIGGSGGYSSIVGSENSITVPTATFTGATSGTDGGHRSLVALGAPTYAASSTTTTTNASTLYIAGAPSAGTNQTITNAYALYAGSGQTYLGGATTTRGPLCIAPNSIPASDSTKLIQAIDSAQATTTQRMITLGRAYSAQDSAALTYSWTATGSTSNFVALGLYGASAFNNTLVINGSGFVGIGTASPTFGLDISGTCRCTGAVTLGSTLAVTGVSTLSGNTAINGVLTVGSGAHTIGGTLAATLASGAQTGISSVGTLGSLSVSGSITVGGTSFGSTEASYLAGTTIGAAAASKALVLDASKNITGVNLIGVAAINIGGTAVSYTSAAALGFESMTTSLLTTLTNSSSAGTDSVFRSAMCVRQPTFSSTNAITTTNAASIYVDAAPLSSGNMTITNRYAVYAGGPLFAKGISSFASGSYTYAQQWSTDAALPIGVALQIHGGSSNTPTNNANFGTTTANDMSIITNGIRRMTLLSTGQIGIGTTTPQATLDIVGAVNVLGSGSYSSATSGTESALTMAAPTLTNTITATSQTDASHRYAINIGKPTLAAQNTGVVTTTASTLYIDGAPMAGTNQTITNRYALYSGGPIMAKGVSTFTSGSYERTQVWINDNVSAIAAELWIFNGINATASNSVQLGTTSNNFLSLMTNGTARLTIDTSGNVGIGGTPTYKLDVSGDINTSTNYRTGGTMIVDASRNATFASLTLGATTISEAEIGVLDAVVAGTAAASKALVLDASKNISGINSLTASTASLSSTASPQLALTCSTSTTRAAITMTNNTSRTWEMGVRGTADSSPASGFYIYDAGTTAYRITVNTSGYVGLSMASASYRLDVSGDANVSATYKVNGTTIVDASRNATFASLTLGATTISESEIGVIDAVVAGTAAASKALVLDASKNISGINSISSTTLTLGATTISESEIGVLDAVVAGTAAASKALVLDASKNISGINSVSSTTLTLGTTTISESEIGVLDAVVAGTAASSKALVLDASKNITGINGLTISSLSFGSTLSDRLMTLYSDGSSFYGMGVNLSTLYNLSGSDHAWFSGSTTSAKGTELARLTAAGNLGIGTNAPAYKLEVSGSLNCTSLYINGTIFNASGVPAYCTGATIGTATASKVLVVDASKNITGINSLMVGDSAAIANTPFNGIYSGMATSTSRYMHIGHDAAANNSGSIKFFYGSAGASTNYMSVGCYNSDESLVITGGGLIGIGTNAPRARLDFGINNFNSVTIILHAGSASTADQYSIGMDTTNNEIAMRSKSGTRFFSGCTNSSTGTVIADISTSGLNVNAAADYTITSPTVYSDINSTQATYGLNTTSTKSISIRAAGGIMTSYAFYCLSDRRVKTDIERIALSDAYHFVTQVDPVRYRRKERYDVTSVKEVGYIAQDLHNFPQLLMFNPCEDLPAEDDLDIENVQLAVDYSKVSCYLHTVVNDLTERNHALEDAVAKLQDMVADLQRRLA